MGRKTRNLMLGLTALSLSAWASAAQAGWSRGYLVEWYEPAMYFGDPKVGRDQPGEDCPNGINPDNNWEKLLTTSYRPIEEVKKILDPEYRGTGGNMYAHFPIRGPNKENVYDQPWILPDPGMIEVTGKLAYGFDLDGNQTNGFTSVDGKTRGVDNGFYKASGCVLRFRGPPRQGGSSTYSNDGMHDGVYSIVMVLSGEGDPQNDPNAQLGIYLAKDKMVKDANGGIAAGYTFRIDPKPEFQTVLKVAVKNGVVETTEAQKITMRDFWTPGFFPKELVLEQSKLRFEIKDDGTMAGHFAGFRDWKEHYRGTAGNGSHGSGAIHENLGKFQLPAWWYSLKRNADGMPDPKTGEMRGISTTYAITAIPAHVVTPTADAPVTVAKRFEAEPRQLSSRGQ